MPNPLTNTDLLDHVPPRERVVALIRVSTAGQANEDRGGIPRQRRVIDDTIRSKNLDCVRVYEISDVSGTQVLQNPDVLEILQLVKNRVISGLVVADLDRLFRPAEPTDYAILQVFKDTGAIIYSGDTEYDLSKRDSALFANIRSAISGFELSLMKDRQQGAKEAKRREGRCPSNHLTWPYATSFDRKQQKWIYTDAIATVIEAFRLYDGEGVTNYHEIGRRLGLFNVTVRNILRNPIYTGWRIIDEKRGEKVVSKTGKTYRKKVKRKPDDVIRVQVIEVPAISQDCFDRVQLSMDEVRFNHHERRENEPVHNFGTGIGRCGHCGEILLCCSGKRKSGVRHAAYWCKANYYVYRERLGGCKLPNIRQPDLDALIEAFAVEILCKPSNLTAVIVGSLERSNEVISPFPAATAGAQIDAIKTKEKRWLAAYEAGAFSAEELRTRREQLRREVAAVKAKQPAERRGNSLELEQFVGLVVRGAMRLKRLTDRSEKKAIIQSLFSEVYVKSDCITAFKFRADLPTLDGVSDVASRAPIQVEPPFRLLPPPVPVQAGHKRCSDCGDVHPLALFYPNKGQCKPCIKVKMSAAHRRRKQERKRRA